MISDILFCLDYLTDSYLPIIHGASHSNNAVTFTKTQALRNAESAGDQSPTNETLRSSMDEQTEPGAVFHTGFSIRTGSARTSASSDRESKYHYLSPHREHRSSACPNRRPR